MMKKLTYLSIITILLLTINSVSIAQQQQNSLAKGKEIQELYKHLANGINYPKKAQQANVQGNSIISFNVVDGKLKNLKVATALGYDCDTEVLNNILSFSSFQNIKPGKYALKTSFTLAGSQSAVLNANDKATADYTELKMVITAMAPETTQKTGKAIIKTTEPLIILDGKTFTTGLKSISPENIESIDILKDLSATSLYGDEGKNGVIIITTKIKKEVKEVNPKSDINQKTEGKGSFNEPINFNDALVVLDNEILKAGLSTISPETIDSIVVLKDISAIAKYGEEGRNGVLIITTKKATDKKDSIQKSKQ